MKKIAAINDLSGFGKCSLAVSLPIISVMGIECHPLTTSVLSAQSGYNGYKIVEMEDSLLEFAKDWKSKGFEFDGIMSGYVSNLAQLNSISEIIDLFKTDDNIVLVDPVMGDDGKVYTGYTEEMIEGYKELCKKASVITPNQTELSLLTGTNDIEKAAKILLAQGIKSVIVTGIKRREDTISNAVFTKESSRYFDCEKLTSKAGSSFSGTGDIFASIVIGKLVNGFDVFEAVDTATSFISRCIMDSDITNRNDGIDFEKHLKEI